MKCICGKSEIKVKVSKCRDCADWDKDCGFNENYIEEVDSK